MTAEDTLAQLADLGITFPGRSKAASTDLDAIRARVAAAADGLVQMSPERIRHLLEIDVPWLLAALEAAHEEIALLGAAISIPDSSRHHHEAAELLGGNVPRRASQSTT